MPPQANAKPKKAAAKSKPSAAAKGKAPARSRQSRPEPDSDEAMSGSEPGDPDEEEDDDDDPFAGEEEEDERRRRGGKQKSGKRQRSAAEEEEDEEDNNDEDDEDAPRSIPPDLLIRIMHEFFEKDGTRISKDANAAAAKYMDIFVRETIARAAVEKEAGFVEVSIFPSALPRASLGFAELGPLKDRGGSSV